MSQMLKTVLKNLFVRKPATRNYPFTQRPAIAGSRGRLEIDPAVCIYCGICSKRCPSNALAVSREPKSWTLDPFKCIVCGFCVELCPKKCLKMNPQHTPPSGGK